MGMGTMAVRAFAPAVACLGLCTALAACAGDPSRVYGPGPKENTGTLLGSLTGAAIGSQFGGGVGGHVAGALIGAGVGGLIGNRIGSSLREGERTRASGRETHALSTR